MAKKVAKKVAPKAKTPRLKGKAQVIYFPGDKLNVFKALEKKANKDKGISALTVEALENAGIC